jgi:hypothetical protein
MTPTGFAISYTRDGDPQPHWLLETKGLSVVPAMVVCRTRTEANAFRRQLLDQPGIADAQVWTLEETRERVEEAAARLPGQMYETAATQQAS